MNMDEEREIASIRVGDRIRRALGDIGPLAENIREVGRMLHPIVVDQDGHLIAGRRRLEAARRLGWTRVPVRVLDLRGLLARKAEASENLYRLPLNPVEAEAAWQVLLPMAREAARERQKEGAKTGGRGHKKTLGKLSTRFSVPEVRKARSRAAKATGYSHRTLEKVQVVREASEKDPDKYKPLLDKLDKPNAKVDKVFSEFKKLKVKLDPPALASSEYGDGRVRMLQGDFLQVPLSQLSVGSVNMVITSPPYNLAKGYGAEGDQMSAEEYRAFTGKWLAKAYAVLADKGRCCVNVPFDVGLGDQDLPVYSIVVQAALAVGFRYMFTIVWHKGPSSKRTAWGSYGKPSAPHYQSECEAVVVLYKGSWARPPSGTVDITETEFQDWTAGPWTFPGQPAAQAGGHPAAFPVELPKRLLKLFGYVGDTVLDPFMGSGSTLLACKGCGREGIGVEVEPSYVKAAAERLGFRP